MLTETPQNPRRPPRASPRRRNVPPPSPSPSPAPASAAAALSPSYINAPFRTADAHAPSSPVEHPCVSLFEWWLVRVEGDDRKIAVAGFTESGRNHAAQMFTSAPIVKRHDNCTLQSEDGIVVIIVGSLNISRMRENGFSVEVCENFLIGFPFSWESWNEFYPKMNNSHLGPPTSSTKTGNSQKNSTLFYLEKFQLGKYLDSVGSSFITNLLNNAKNFKDDNTDAFQSCSYLSNETSRFEEFYCDNDISTTEIVAASDDGIKGSAGCREVDDMIVDLIGGSTSKGGHVDVNVSLALADICTGDETYEKAGNKNDIMHSDAREQGSGSHLLNSNHMPSDLEGGNVNDESSVDLGANCPMDVAVDLERGSTSKGGHVDVNISLALADICTGDETYEKAGNKNDIMHSDAREQGSGIHLLNSNHMPSDLEGGNVNDESSVDLGANCPMDVAVDLENSPPTSHHRTPVASLKNQGQKKKAQHIALNKKEKKPIGPREEQRSVHEVFLGATRSPVIKRPITCAPLTRGKAKELSVSTPESLKLRRTRSGHVVVPRLDLECQQVVYDRPVGPREEQRSVHEVLLGATRSPVIKRPIACASLTRGKAKELSVSTPESLKLRRTRSGRVIVPRLDPACQQIIYDRDRLISGIAGLGLQSPPKGSKSRTPARKKGAR